MEELLKIAKEKYPVGTGIKSAYNLINIDTVIGDYTQENDGSIHVDCQNTTGVFIYYKGVWAEIISKPEVKEETMTLLEEAKRRFPVGTKFVPAHIYTDEDNMYCVVVEEGVFEERKGGHVFQTVYGRGWIEESEDSKYGNTWWDRAIYYEGKWARIIEEPKARIVESLSELKAEDPVMWGGPADEKIQERNKGFLVTEEKDFFETAYISLCKMQQAKNKKYGESALSDKFNLFDGKTKLAPRLKDKLNRVDNSPVLLKNDISDLIGYLMLVCKENGWNNFEDLID